MDVTINGQPRSFAELGTEASMGQLLEVLGIKADRVAVEQNGEIVPRAEWAAAKIIQGDRLEIVHFVGGGA